MYYLSIFCGNVLESIGVNNCIIIRKFNVEFISKKPGISRTSINCLEKGAKNEMNQSKITDRLLPYVFDRL